MSYPNIADYQQLAYGSPTGSVDCTAEGGAVLVHASTNGAIQVTGRQVRLASNEPRPDPDSPGLNVQQVDDAVYRLTDGKVNLWTPIPGEVGRAGVRDRIVDGRWCNLSVNRGVLVDRGFGGGNRFRGSHNITLHIRLADLSPIIGDTLVPSYMSASWDAVFDAAQAVTNDRLIRVSFTRDLIADYRARVAPGRAYYKYTVVDGRIMGRRKYHTDNGFSADCSPPRTHSGTMTRSLVRLTSGSRAGYWISAYYAREV